MEKFSYNSYPDSADSSPRSREIDFENPPPWEEQSQQQQSYKVKFMCSYGGKIQPRPHDNQLAYVGGETKILSVDRSIKFSSMIGKLAAIIDGDVSFKYQLPGEDLDALISVTNDDDLEHMMHEYDRLLRSSSRPARMRLFLFPIAPSSFASGGSNRSDREQFVEALNSGPPSRSETDKAVTAAPNNADFLFGSEKVIAPPPPPSEKVHDAVPEPQVIGDQHVIAADPVEIQRQLQELQRLQIRDQEQQQQQQAEAMYQQQQQQAEAMYHQQQQQAEAMFQQQQQHHQQAEAMFQQQHHHQQAEAMYRRKSNDDFAETGGYYTPAFAQNPQPTTLQQTPGYWPGKHIPGGVYPPTTTTPGLPEQPVYVIPAPAPGTVYHAPPPSAVVRPLTGQPTQGYYQNVQRMAPDAYREQPAYKVVQPPPAGSQAPPQFSAGPPQFSAPAAPQVRPVASGGAIGLTETGYTQVGYDGKQVYYTASGGGIVVPPQPYQGIGLPVTGSGELRAGQDGKVASNVSQGSV